MNSINFVPTKKGSNQPSEKLKRTVMSFTTIVLVIYLVAAAGFMGWWWLWSNKEQQASSEIESLQSQITGFTDTERMIWSLAERTKNVNDFLTARESASAAAASVTEEGYSLVEWSFIKGGTHRVKVAAATPDKVYEYVKKITPRYTKVQIAGLLWTEYTGWNGDLLLTGRK